MEENSEICREQDTFHHSRSNDVQFVTSQTLE